MRIQEPQPFDRKWYSHKFRGAGVRYEVAISVVGGHIVWVHGPFPAGLYSDQRIFNMKLKNCLEQNEKVLADLGYAGPCTVHGSIIDDDNDERASRIRAHHEQINGRLKSFSCLENRWRHSLDKHKYCFFAVATVVQLEIDLRSCMRSTGFGIQMFLTINGMFDGVSII